MILLSSIRSRFLSGNADHSVAELLSSVFQDIVGYAAVITHRAHVDRVL